MKRLTGCSQHLWTGFSGFHVWQADDLLLQLSMRHIQRACSSHASRQHFLAPEPLQLIARWRVSRDVRFQACCLTTVFLASAAPQQAAKARALALLLTQPVTVTLLQPVAVQRLL